MTTDSLEQAGDAPLRNVTDVTAVRREVSVPEDSPSPDLLDRAQQYTEELLGQIEDQALMTADVRDKIDSLGRDLQVQAVQQSQMLLGPVKELGGRGADGGPVASGLTDLRLQVEALDPNRVDLSPGWPVRLLGAIPGFGTPLKRYFAKYQSAQVTIDSIIKSLENGREQLRRDNVTLGDDQGEMGETGKLLVTEIAFARAVDQELDERIAKESGESQERGRLIQEELQFPLRQRTLDLQQQLAVTQQGVLATEIIIRNNRELMRGVDRSISVTATALRTAVSVAFALAHQRIVLDKVAAVSQTTSTLISGTAERLRTQGAEIHAQSAGTQLDMEHLKSAFADINAALDEILQFRREALPQMAQTIVEFDALASEAESRIRDFSPMDVETQPPQD